MTSPLYFAAIVLLKHCVGRAQGLVGGKKTGKLGRTPEQLFQDFATLRLGQSVKGLQLDVVLHLPWASILRSSSLRV